MSGEGYSHALLVTGARTWDDAPRMRRAFADVWRAWGPGSVTRPLLVVGDCPTGADAMAASAWRDLGLDVEVHRADWSRGGWAGPVRNQAMVDRLVGLRDAGTTVRACAFADLCSRPDCPRTGEEQLRSGLGIGGHYGHGTMDTRARAIAAGVPVEVVLAARLPPF